MGLRPRTGRVQSMTIQWTTPHGHNEIKGLIFRILGNTPYVSNVETNKAGKNASQYGG